MRSMDGIHACTVVVALAPITRVRGILSTTSFSNWVESSDNSLPLWGTDVSANRHRLDVARLRRAADVRVVTPRRVGAPSSRVTAKKDVIDVQPGFAPQEFAPAGK
jgi:hypothetical protein